MCGIVGVASRRPGTTLPEGSVAALSHRGPDGEGRRSAQGERFGWDIGHTRLAIVDLSDAGQQPMTNEDDTLAMVFNGEIYNSAELRAKCQSAGHQFRSHMDGEVILHLWEMEGLAGLARLNGIFAVAIADTRTGQVVVARDPVGVKPLFWSSDDRGTLWFASELSALRTAGAPVGADDVVGLAQFLTFLWIPAPRTPFKDAHSLLPGHALVWTPGGVEDLVYCDPLVPQPGPDAGGDAGGDATGDILADEFRLRLAEAVDRQLQSDVPVGLMASGGVDSSLLWVAAGERLAQAYTVTWLENTTGERLADDATAVKTLQARLATPICWLPGIDADMDVLPSSGDLLADPAYELTRHIARRARADGIKVLLSGQGGDELFAGYRRHATAPLVGRTHLALPARGASWLLKRSPWEGPGPEYGARLLGAMAEGDPFRAYLHLCSYSTAADRAAALGSTEDEVSDEVVWQQHAHVYQALPKGLSPLRRFMTLDLTVYLPGLGLTYADRAGMEFGVEIRVPWLDLEFLRWTLTLPDRALTHHGRGKWLPRRAGEQALGAAVANRSKRGFAAPASTVAPSAARHGARGFRQGAYFARAQGVLAAHHRSEHHRVEHPGRPVSLAPHSAPTIDSV